MTTNDMERSKIIESSDTIEAIEECYRMGWSDGLPVVPPVDYKVCLLYTSPSPRDA